LPKRCFIAVGTAMSAEEVDEPLRFSAPLARRLAPQLCARDPESGANCEWSHALWQYLRLFGIVTGASRHAEFFRSAFDAVALPGRTPRVLVSGAADYSMLAHALAFLRARGSRPDITVVDRCETPLELNRWFAKRAGWPIQTQRSDVRLFKAEQPFDVICTHAFFGYFAPQDRPALLSKWQELLVPGGKLITVNRVQESSDGTRSAFAPQQARAFCDEVERQASAFRSSVELEVDDLVEQAALYTRQAGFWPVRSAGEIEAVFEEAGFTLDRLECGPEPVASAGPRISGPSTPGNATFAKVMANRR
jgi:hypothetical protein